MFRKEKKPTKKEQFVVFQDGWGYFGGMFRNNFDVKYTSFSNAVKFNSRQEAKQAVWLINSFKRNGWVEVVSC